MKNFILMCVFLFSAATFSQEKIKTGVFINDIQQLDLQSHSYTLDMYIWFKWKDKNLNPASTFEFMNPYELWAQTKTTTYENPVKLETGEYYQVVRVQGSFSKKFNLTDYPFDHQDLPVTFEDSIDDKSGASYELDENPITMNNLISLPGFDIQKPDIKIETYDYKTNFGDPRVTNGKLTHSRVIINIPIKRPVIPYLIKLILPIFCVILCACLMFLFKPNYVDARVGVGITALLTIVALQITLNNDLPEIAYLILIDKIYLVSYFFIVSGLAIVVRASWLIEKGDEYSQHVIEVDRKALLILSIIYVLTVGWMLIRVL